MMRRVLAASLALALAACAARAPSAYALAFAEAERALHAGRYSEAADRFEAAAADSTQSDRDRDHATFLAAEAHASAGDRAGARAILEKLATSKTTYGAEAQFALATLLLDSGDPAGWTALDVFARAHPSDGHAIVAIRRRARHEDETSTEAALAYLDGLVAPTRGTELEEFVLYERALRLARLQRDEPALAAYLDLAARFPYPGPHWDDALFHASELHERLGKYDDALADLRRMLVEREHSDSPGPYERPLFPSAAFRIAVLLRDRIGDKKAARAAFLAFANDFVNAQTRDDALWEAARLGENDDDRCSPLKELLSVRPDSRYVPCAITRCPSLQRPANSGAPKTCHAYLER